MLWCRVRLTPVTGRDELVFAGIAPALVDGDGAAEYTLDGAGPEENVPPGLQAQAVGCLGQPAPLARVSSLGDGF